MDILIIIVFSLAGYKLLVALYNLLFPTRLSDQEPSDKFVSVLIPARNEEVNIESLLKDLILQDYPHFEILIYDDFSGDKTAEIVAKYEMIDKRIRCIHPKELPENWLGKNHACFQLARYSKGEYLIFLDADVRAEKDLITSTVTHSVNNNLGLLSIFPRQEMHTLGEKLTVPLMHYFLISLLPLRFVRYSPFKAHSAANGQFMMFDRKTYKKYKPHETMKSQVVEDIAIGSLLKKNKVVCDCIVSPPQLSCRMYSRYTDAVDGFSKNIRLFFGKSVFVSIIMGILILFGPLIVILYDVKLFLVYALVVVITKAMTSRTSNQSIIMNLIYHVPQLATFAYIFLKSFNRQKEWKGRTIS